MTFSVLLESEVVKMKLKLTKKIIDTCIDLWKDREEGWHTWRKYYSKWITIETCTDNGEDYLLITLANEVDMLGYPYGKAINFFCIDEEDFNSDPTLSNLIGMVVEE